MAETALLTCENLPNLLNSFVDTFVDFCITGEIHQMLENSNHNPIQTLYTSPDRLIALGDIHGDLEKTKQALKLAGLTDDSDQWIGGSATLVQVGDILDRGEDELKILYMFERLRNEAVRNGGNVITLNGNHEIMNMDGDFKYVSESGLEDFSIWGCWFKIGNSMKRLCHGLPKPIDIFHGIPSSFPDVKPELFDGFRARIAALRPQGPISTRFFSKNVTVAIVGSSVFVHGGLLPKHVDYGLLRMNEDVRDWIIGQKKTVSSQLVRDRHSVVWSRIFSDEKCENSTLQLVLSKIPGAKRIIMGHTIQKSGINGVYDDKAIRIDVGFSKGCKNRWPEVLEIIKGKELRILTSNPTSQLEEIEKTLITKKTSKRRKLFSRYNFKRAISLLIHIFVTILSPQKLSALE